MCTSVKHITDTIVSTLAIDCRLFFLSLCINLFQPSSVPLPFSARFCCSSFSVFNGLPLCILLYILFLEFSVCERDRCCDFYVTFVLHTENFYTFFSLANTSKSPQPRYSWECFSKKVCVLVTGYASVSLFTILQAENLIKILESFAL